MRSRRPIDPELPRRLAASFFATAHEAGAPFWPTREIATRFRVSRHAANVAVGELVRQGVLERRGRQGAFVAAQARPISVYQQAVKPHLAVVMPTWAAPEWNQFGVELRQELLRGAQKRRWNITFYQEPGQLSDPQFPVRWRAAGCTALVMVNAVETGVVPLTNLRVAGVPMVNIGGGTPSFDPLGIPVVDGDDVEAMYQLVFQLAADGHRQIAVAGDTEPRLGSRRVEACRRALEQFEHVAPSDMFIESFDLDYVTATLARRLEATPPAEAVIFQDFPTFIKALENISSFESRIRDGLPVAVFDTCFLDRRYPDLPLIEVTLNPAELATRAIVAVERLMAGEPVAPKTFLPYRIVWPDRVIK